MNRFLPVFLLHYLLLFLLLLAGRGAYASATIDFFYFNPDSVQFNFALLTRGMESFFEEIGLSAHFQAFSQQNDFDRLVRQKNPALVLVPSWYYEHYGKSLSLTPILTSLSQGKPTYTKLLLTRKSTIHTLGDLEGKTVAMTSMGPDTGVQLGHYFNIQGFDFSKLNIITTAKDADALYALALGQVDAAVVGEATLEVVGQVNRRVLDVVEKRALSKPISMPLLCVIKGNSDPEERERLKRIFLEGGSKFPLPSFMNMLQITGWQSAML